MWPGFLSWLVEGFWAPLLFMLSGYFTADMALRRGTGAMLKRRFIRIGIPFVVAVFALTPLTTWAYNWSGAHILRALEPEFDPQDPSAGDFFQAARLGHLPRVQWEVDRGDSRLDVGQLFGGTPLADAHDLQRFDRRGIAALHWAAIGGQLEVIELLLDEGVDPNLPSVDGRTALHFAALYSQPAAIKLLLQRGADPMRADRRGATPADMVRYSWTRFAASQMHLLGRQLGFAVDVERVRRDLPEVQERLGLGPRAQEKSRLRWPSTMRLVQQLWFLWYLLLYGLILALGLAAFARLSGDLRARIVRWRPFALVACVLVSVAVVWLERAGATDLRQHVAPQLSWIPGRHGFFVGLSFFLFGACSYRADGRGLKISAIWMAGLVLGGVTAAIAFQSIRAQFFPPLSGPDGPSALSRILVAAYPWFVCLGLLAACNRLVRGRSESWALLAQAAYPGFFVYYWLTLIMLAWVFPVTQSALANVLLVGSLVLVLILLGYLLYRLIPSGPATERRDGASHNPELS